MVGQSFKPVVFAMIVAAALVGCKGADMANAIGKVDVGGMIDAGSTAVKAYNITDADMRMLSEQACAQADKQSKVAGSKDKYTTRLNSIFKGMPTDINGQKINYKVYLTKDINAWAMANGCVRVYSGLMDMMTDDEVRGVIGHEIGHVALGHSRKGYQTAYAAAAARQAAASTGNSTVTALNASQLGEFTEALINAQFSQSQESESDDYSFDLLTKYKFKREGLVTAFQKLAKLGDSNSMLSSHPSSSSRAKHIEDRIAANK